MKLLVVLVLGGNLCVDGSFDTSSLLLGDAFPYKFDIQAHGVKGEHQPALGFEERKKLVRQQILDFCREKEELLTNAEAADDIIEEIRQGKKRSSRREAFLLGSIEQVIWDKGLPEFQTNLTQSCDEAASLTTAAMASARKRVLEKVNNGDIVLPAAWLND